MRKYESIVIINPKLEEKENKDLLEKYKKMIEEFSNREVTVEDLGEKKLAYEIEKQVRGYYHLLNVECESKAVKEFDRKALIDERILRHLIIKEEE